MPAQTSTLYAMYLQATRTNPNSGKVQRKQWIVLPPLPEPVAMQHKVKGRDQFLMFSREQANPENRVKWRYAFDATGDVAANLPNEIKAMIAVNETMQPDYKWLMSPILTAEVTVAELAALQETPQTPYVLLRRFEKVARRKYGLSI